MADTEKDPLCTVDELLVFGVICIVYCAILFSVDPEWVGWAAPLAFGGALYAADPPPASANFGSPQDVIVLAYLYGLVSLLGISLLPRVEGTSHFSWLSWLKAESESGSIARVRRFLKSRFTLTPGR
jgi:hypothetical protein